VAPPAGPRGEAARWRHPAPRPRHCHPRGRWPGADLVTDGCPPPTTGPCVSHACVCPCRRGSRRTFLAVSPR
jgi:hypothetical protein